MSAIEVFRKYLKGSMAGISTRQKINKLNYMEQQVRGVLQGLLSCFAGDDSLYDKDDHTIYTLMKKDLFGEMLINNTDSVRKEGASKLNALLEDIERMMAELAA